MIITIEGWRDEARRAYCELIAAMHRNRHEVFAERLGWVPASPGGEEIDGFDFCNPLYVISVDAAGKYQGSLRLLPTTGPNMLRDVFSQLLGDHEPIEHPNIWESSRICATAKRALPELIVGIGDVAKRAGVTGVVTVIDERMYRLLTMLGCKTETLGPPQDIGGVLCRAIMFEPGSIDAVRERVATNVG